MTTTQIPSTLVPFAPSRIRGTVYVLVGRGETPAVYERFAHRLTFDGYAVTVRAPGTKLPSADRDKVTPTFVVGVDTGALDAIELVAVDPDVADGIVLVGLPGRNDPEAGDWTEEVAARATCPTQQGRLRDESIIAPLSLTADQVPDLKSIPACYPVLALHGRDDRISPVHLAQPRYAVAGVTSLTLVEDGGHDALNSIYHRSVSATIVAFFEHIRANRSAEVGILEPIALTSETGTEAGVQL